MRGSRLYFANVANLLALALVGSFVILAAAAPLLAPPEDPGHPSSFRLLFGHSEPFPLPPSPGLPLGTAPYYRMSSTGSIDLVHFDVFYSLVWGTRSVLRFGIITAFATALLGVVIGSISGYLGGMVNNLAMRIADAFLAFPVIAGVWLFRVIMDTAGLELLDYNDFTLIPIANTPLQKLVQTLSIDPVMITLILFSWMAYARIISVNIATLKKMDFTLSARSIGASNSRIIFRHLLPNAVAPAIVLLARDVGGVVVLQAAFAFIGVSGTANSAAIPEWSRILMLGRTWIIGQGGNPLTNWWVYLPITIALILFGLGWNVLGDGLNAVMNPWTAQRKGSRRGGPGRKRDGDQALDWESSWGGYPTLPSNRTRTTKAKP